MDINNNAVFFSLCRQLSPQINSFTMFNWGAGRGECEHKEVRSRVAKETNRKFSVPKQPYVLTTMSQPAH